MCRAWTSNSPIVVIHVLALQHQYITSSLPLAFSMYHFAGYIIYISCWMNVNVHKKSRSSNQIHGKWKRFRFFYLLTYHICKCMYEKVSKPRSPHLHKDIVKIIVSFSFSTIPSQHIIVSYNEFSPTAILKDKNDTICKASKRENSDNKTGKWNLCVIVSELNSEVRRVHGWLLLLTLTIIIIIIIINM